MIAVTCAIIQENGKILAVQRSKTMKLPLKWEFPGGKVEKGEEEKECLIREIREELHLHITPIKKLTSVVHDYDGFRIRLIPFLSQIRSGSVYLSEHRAYRWVETGKLMEMDWAEADAPVAREVMELFGV